jgi:hypothetical protein
MQEGMGIKYFNAAILPGQVSAAIGDERSADVAEWGLPLGCEPFNASVAWRSIPSPFRRCSTISLIFCVRASAVMSLIWTQPRSGEMCGSLAWALDLAGVRRRSRRGGLYWRRAMIASSRAGVTSGARSSEAIPSLAETRGARSIVPHVASLHVRWRRMKLSGSAAWATSEHIRAELGARFGWPTRQGWRWGEGLHSRCGLAPYASRRLRGSMRRRSGRARIAKGCSTLLPDVSRER